MKIAVVGCGYVGLVAAACLADGGHRVVAVERDPAVLEVLQRGEVHIAEPGLEERVRQGLEAGRLRFTASLEPAVVAEAELVLIAVGTPADPVGQVDLGALGDAVDKLEGLAPTAVVAIKSTVPVGTARQVEERLRSRGVEAAVVVNPEFLREGHAVEDFLHPDRVVVGARDEAAFTVMRRVYRPFEVEVWIEVGREEAELIKYASNAYLAVRLGFMEELASFCARVGVDPRPVLRGMGADHRIGRSYLQLGAGFGGSCLPKDARAMLAMARGAGAPLGILSAALDANHRWKLAIVERVERILGGLTGRRVALFGLGFKAGVADLREAASRTVVRGLLDGGAELRLFDPALDPGDDPDYRGAVVCSDPWDALRGAELWVVLNPEPSFRSMDLHRVARTMDAPVLLDVAGLFQRGRARPLQHLSVVGGDQPA